MKYLIALLLMIAAPLLALENMDFLPGGATLGADSVSADTARFDGVKTDGISSKTAGDSVDFTSPINATQIISDTVFVNYITTKTGDTLFILKLSKFSEVFLVDTVYKSVGDSVIYGDPVKMLYALRVAGDVTLDSDISIAGNITAADSILSALVVKSTLEVIGHITGVIDSAGGAIRSDSADLALLADEATTSLDSVFDSLTVNTAISVPTVVPPSGSNLQLGNGAYAVFPCTTEFENKTTFSDTFWVDFGLGDLARFWMKDGGGDTDTLVIDGVILKSN